MSNARGRGGNKFTAMGMKFLAICIGIALLLAFLSAHDDNIAEALRSVWNFIVNTITFFRDLFTGTEGFEELVVID